MSATTELQAGRELDALIAERVMGWTEVREWRNGYVDRLDALGGKAPGAKYVDDVPFYSWDLAAAFSILDHFGFVKVGHSIPAVGDAVEWYADLGRLVEVDGEMRLREGTGTGPTAPLAICRAALATFEEGDK